MKRAIAVIILLCLPFLALSQATKQTEPNDHAQAIQRAESDVAATKQAVQGA